MKRDYLIIILILALIVSISFMLYFGLRPKQCYNYFCFQENMFACSRASLINEEPEASWRYEVLRKLRNGCEIKVTLLQAKEGDLKLRNFEGHSMICIYPRGVAAYPDKDLSLCHGRLKEDIQGIIIEKMHSYIMSNLTRLKEEFDKIEINT